VIAVTIIQDVRAIIMKSRSISGIIACCYLVVAYILNGPLMTLRMAGFLILPLACYGLAMKWAVI
jgi:hypothetical protein